MNARAEVVDQSRHTAGGPAAPAVSITQVLGGSKAAPADLAVADAAMNAAVQHLVKNNAGVSYFSGLAEPAYGTSALGPAVDAAAGSSAMKLEDFLTTSISSDGRSAGTRTVIILGNDTAALLIPSSASGSAAKGLTRSSTTAIAATGSATLAILQAAPMSQTLVVTNISDPASRSAAPRKPE